MSLNIDKKSEIRYYEGVLMDRARIGSGHVPIRARPDKKFWASGWT